MKTPKAYFDRNALVVSASTFRGPGIGIQTVDVTDYGLNLNNCTFETWGDSAVSMNGGHFVCSNSEFEEDKAAFNFGFDVDQVILTGNTFKEALSLRMKNTGKTTTSASRGTMNAAMCWIRRNTTMNLFPKTNQRAMACSM